MMSNGSDGNEQSASTPSGPHHTLLGRTHLTYADVAEFRRKFSTTEFIPHEEERRKGYEWPADYECILTCPVCAKVCH
jgi:hypothetical protein